MNIFFLLFFYILIIIPYLYIKQQTTLKKQLLLFEGILFIITTIHYIYHPTSYINYIIYMINVSLIILQNIYMLLSFINSILRLSIKNLSIIIIALSLTSYGIYHHYDKQIETYNIHINKQTTLPSLKACLISDIHLGSGTYLNDIHKLVNNLNNRYYDIILICGDFYDEGTSPQLLDSSLKILNQLKSKYGTYMINGNHEYFSSLSNINTSSIHLINDQYICINNQFNIIGRKDITTKSKNLKDICKGMDTSLPTIVLDHNPRRFLEIKGYGDIQLSGHTHKGQIFPMTSLISIFHDYTYGFYNHNDIQLIVTSGYGSWGLPFRLGSQCEIVEINLSF